MGLATMFVGRGGPNQDKHREMQPWSSGLRHRELEENTSPELFVYMRICIWFFCSENNR
jgi:hypothetical protein